MRESRKADPLQPAEAVLKFLASIATEAEAEFYLRLFRSRATESFATIAVTAASLQHGVDGVAMDLCFLRALQLMPVVVLGLDSPGQAREHAELIAARLDDDGLGSEVLAIDAPIEAIRAALADGTTPLLFASEPGDSPHLHALARVLRELRTPKLIYLRPEGGLSLLGQRLSVVNLTTDYDAMLHAEALDAGAKEVLRASRELIFERVPGPLIVSVTSPLNLLRELFTVKGAGTLLRKGVRIERHRDYLAVDRARLLALLSSSFGKTPYPTVLDRELRGLYLEEAYRGAALVTDSPLGPYLSKFAVTREAQGEGIGQDLWNALSADCSSLFWRARRENPIRAWYERQCQGRFDSGPWTVYFRGIEPAQVPAAIDFACGQPVDFDS